MTNQKEFIEYLLQDVEIQSKIMKQVNNAMQDYIKELQNNPELLEDCGCEEEKE